MHDLKLKRVRLLQRDLTGLDAPAHVTHSLTRGGLRQPAVVMALVDGGDRTPSPHPGRFATEPLRLDPPGSDLRSKQIHSDWHSNDSTAGRPRG